MPVKKLTAADKQAANIKRLNDVIRGSASVIVKTRGYVENSLGINSLMQFIKEYLKKDPNVLYFSPKEKLEKRTLSLLLFLQCLDDGNPDTSDIIKELNKTLKGINNAKIHTNTKE